VDQQASGDDRVHRVRQPVMSAIETARFVGMGHVRWHRRKSYLFSNIVKADFRRVFFVQSRSIAFGSGVDRN
jgi:hypothetical protein